MSDSIIFALARFKGFFDAQPVKLLIFDPQGIRLIPEEGEPVEWQWEKIDSIIYIHSRSVTPGWIGNLGGFFTRPKEDQFHLKVEGKLYELPLEIDAFHRKGEIRIVLERMYKAGVPLQERTGPGKRTFLLKPITSGDLEKSVEELRNSG